MNCTVTKTFKTQTGELVPVGRLLELTADQILTLKGFVMAVSDNDPPVFTFEQSGDPVSCPYWYRVCWAVGMYQRHCTRGTDCLTYKFLHRRDDVADKQVIDDRRESGERVKRLLST